MIEIFNSVASNYCHKQKKTNIFSKGSLRVLIVQKKKKGGVKLMFIKVVAISKKVS